MLSIELVDSVQRSFCGRWYFGQPRVVQALKNSFWKQRKVGILLRKLVSCLRITLQFSVRHAVYPYRAEIGPRCFGRNGSLPGKRVLTKRKHQVSLGMNRIAEAG